MLDWPLIAVNSIGDWHPVGLRKVGTNHRRNGCRVELNKAGPKYQNWLVRVFTEL